MVIAFGILRIKMWEKDHTETPHREIDFDVAVGHLPYAICWS